MALHLENGQVVSGDTLRLHIDKATVSAGSFLVILGRNGAGKSTLLDFVAGMAPSSEGRVWFDELPHTRESTRRQPPSTEELGVPLGYLYQSSENSLFAGSVVEEFAMTLRLSVRDARASWNTFQDKYLRKLGLGQIAADDIPARWSTGMQRKLAFTLAVARRPAWFLLDEPTAGLDAAGRTAMLAMLRDHTAQGHSVMLATHDLDACLPLATRVWILDAGRIVFDGTPETLCLEPEILIQTGVGLPPSLRLQMALRSAKLIEHVQLQAPTQVAERVIETLRTSAKDEQQPWRPTHFPAISPEHIEHLPSIDEWSGKAVAKTVGAEIDARFRWLGMTALTIGIAITHSSLGIACSVAATVILLVILRANWRRVVRWSVTWVMFAAITAVIAGVQFQRPFPAHTSFHALSALADVVSVIPYWCFLQLGQLLVTTSSPFEVGAILDNLLRTVRIRAHTRRMIALVATMVYRFIPAISRMYQEQLRAYQARAIGLKRPRFAWTRVSHVLAPFVIRLIAYGETTADAVAVRGLFHRPFPTAAFHPTSASVKDWLFAMTSLLVAIFIAISGRM